MPERRYPDTLDGLLEPSAIAARPDWDGQIRLSQAISMKRIADALTGEGPSFLTAPINNYGEPIGEAIQGQLIRGLRGDDRI